MGIADARRHRARLTGVSRGQTRTMSHRHRLLNLGQTVSACIIRARSSRTAQCLTFFPSAN
jgi:hypothetical protein